MKIVQEYTQKISTSKNLIITQRLNKNIQNWITEQIQLQVAMLHSQQLT